MEGNFSQINIVLLPHVSEVAHFMQSPNLEELRTGSLINVDVIILLLFGTAQLTVNMH